MVRLSLNRPESWPFNPGAGSTTEQCIISDDATKDALLPLEVVL